MTDITPEINELLAVALEDTVADVGSMLEDVSEYAQEQAEALSKLVGQAGYAQALTAARDNVAMRGGIAAVAGARKAERRSLRLINTALSMMAKILATGLAV